MLLAKTRARLDRAQAQEARFRPNKTTSAQLSGRTLVMFVGPVAVGKTTLINHIANHYPDFGKTITFTTRDPRPDDDPAMFRYFPHDETHVSALLDQIDRGEVMQYAIHPVTKRVYGSYTEDSPHRYNLLATLSGGVEAMQRLPFASVVTIAVATDPHEWQQWLQKRKDTSSAVDRESRLQEARISLRWALHHRVLWINNLAGQIDVAARQAVACAKGRCTSDLAAQRNAQAILEYISKGQA